MMSFTKNTRGIQFTECWDTWYVVNTLETLDVNFQTKMFYEFENEEVGDDLPHLIATAQGEVIAYEVYDGFEDETFKEYLSENNLIE